MTSAAMTLVGTAYAQDAAHGGNVEEIVVTARKLGENLAKAPVAATLIDAETLARERVTSLKDLNAPNLIYHNPSAYAVAFIRGIGSNFALAGLESSVATYVDGVYLERQLGSVLDAVDLANITVLNGPQGTLYGRNATGGAIVLQTADPTDKLEGHITGEYGRFNHSLVEAVLNVPLTDTLAIRVAGQTKRQDGYLLNINNGKMEGESRVNTVRFKVKWTPTPNFSAIYSLQYADSKGQGLLEKAFIGAPQCLACVVDPTAKTGAGQPFYSTTQTPGYFNNSRYISNTLTLNYQSDGYSITSVTDLRNSVAPGQNDLDSVGTDFYHGAFVEKGPTFYHETYARTSFDSPLNGLLGVTYMNSKDKQKFAFGGLILNGADGHNFNRAVVESYSAYGELNYNFGNGFKLVAGARYNHDNKDITSQNDALAIIAAGLPPSAASFQRSAKFNSVTPRAVASYENDNGYYYLSYNRGVKSGGYGAPLLDPTTPLSRPETLDSFEIGAKNTFLDGRLSTTIDGFYGFYKDIQVQIIEAGAATILLQNAASGRVSGIEFNSNFAVTPDLILKGGINYTHNYFKSYTNGAVYGPSTNPTCTPVPVGIAQCTENLSGTSLPNSPKWTGYVGVDYTAGIGGGWTARTNLTAHFTTGYDFFAGALGYYRFNRTNGYTTVDGALTFTLPDGDTEIGGYVRNMFEAHYLEFGQTSFFDAYNMVGQPRSYGVRVSRKF